MQAKRLTMYIGLALLLGLIVGYVINQRYGADKAVIDEIVYYLKILTDIFLRLIKMIIAPLVVGTLVAGIAHTGDSATLGRMGVRSILWFIGASLVSLSLGMILVNLFAPGVGVGLAATTSGTVTGIETTKFTLAEFITHVVPKSIFDAMANNEVLPIVVFSVFFGVAITAVGEKARPIVRGMDALVEVMLQVTNYVMRYAPVAVFAAVAAVVAKQGLGIIQTYAAFIGEFYLALVILWAVLIGACFLIAGSRALQLPRYFREPLLIAFSTASSEAAFPRTLEALERFGVPRKISGFVLPLGYSFNLDGSMMYMTFATMFIAQAYGMHLDFWQQATMLLTLMLTSKGMAAVPRASLVVIAATMNMFHIPEAGLLLILGIDQFLDMGRTATNVVGNAVASTVVAKMEGQLGPLQSPGVPMAHAPSSHHPETGGAHPL